MALNINYLFKSKDVHIFPSSFRGEYEVTVNGSSSQCVFDPESRLNTEANFTVPKPMFGKSNYIVSYTKNVDNKVTSISFVLGGYYFEISNLNDYPNVNNNTLKIKLRDITLISGSDYDANRKTQVLDTFESNTDKVLDYFYTENGINTYYFTGITFENSSALESAASASILLIKNGDINQEMLLPTVDHGSGENTLFHGEGLVASYKNQTIFGTYNDNKESTLFEVGIGSSDENRKNALEIKSTETNIRTATNINGNTIITGSTKIDGTTEITDTTEVQGDLIISKDTESTSSATGALKVAGGVGIGKNLNVDGDTNLKGTLKITYIDAVDTEGATEEEKVSLQIGPTIVDEDSVEQLTVSVPTILNDTLTVGGATTLNNTLTVAEEKKTTLSGELEVNRATQLNNNLTVGTTEEGGSKATTLNGTLQVTNKTTLDGQLEVNGTVDINAQTTNITGTVNINTNNQTSPGAVTIYGDTTINSNLTVADGKTTTLGGDLAVTGKATSDSTAATDDDTTLTTKDYVDSKITALDVTSVGEDGKYLKAISETDGKITATPQSFDTTISSTSADTNAPTSKAVEDRITAKINELDYDLKGGSSESTDADGNEITIFKHITSISQADGKIEATDSTIVQNLNNFEKSLEDGQLASAKATKDYVDSSAAGIRDDINKSANEIRDEISTTANEIRTYVDRYLIINTTAGVASTYETAAWTTLSLDSELSSNYKIVGATATSYLNRANYKTETWDMGKNEGDYLQAENTLYWTNGIYINWDDSNLYILNTNAKNAINVSLLIMLERKS